MKKLAEFITKHKNIIIFGGVKIYLYICKYMFNY